MRGACQKIDRCNRRFAEHLNELILLSSITTADWGEELASSWAVSKKMTTASVFFDAFRGCHTINSLERHPFYRPIEASWGVLRLGGFHWAMSRPQHRQENCCLPPIVGDTDNTTAKVDQYGVGIDCHSTSSRDLRSGSATR